MSVKEQVMAHMRAAGGPQTAAELARVVEAPMQGIYAALSKLVSDGDLVRVRTGLYALVGADVSMFTDALPTQPPALSDRPKRKKRALPPPADEIESEPAADGPEFAVWSNGAASIALDGAVINLDCDQVRRLVRMIAAVTEACPTTAASH